MIFLLFLVLSVGSEDGVEYRVGILVTQSLRLILDGLVMRVAQLLRILYRLLLLLASAVQVAFFLRL